MDRYLFESFVFEIEEDNLMEDSLVMFAKLAKNKVEKKGNNKVTFNYYPQEKNQLQLVIEAVKDGKSVAVNNMKVHHTSPDVWKLKIINPLSGFDGYYMASREDGDGLVIIRLVNEQVLGEIKEGDIIEAQVAGMAMAIDIFENEKEYEDNTPESKSGKKYFMADGSLIPTNMIVNNNTNLSDEERKEIDHSFDNLIDFKGTIKLGSKCQLKMYDIDVNSYYIARIDTQFGGLDIIIPLPMMPKELKGFGAGNIISGKILLSADVCINDYEKYASELVIESKEQKNE